MKMNISQHKEFAKHPVILASLGMVVVIAVGSFYYYSQEAHAPKVDLSESVSSDPVQISASGTVEPAENPNLAFASGGRVTQVRVSTGEKVYPGATLASLDVSVLAAQRAQAQANADVAQAHLAEMLAGARQEDVRAKQTAVDQANNALLNLYMNAATNILQSYDKAFSGFSQNTDNLFSQPNTSSPVLTFTTINSQLASTVVTDRILAQQGLTAWQNENNALPGASREHIEAALEVSLGHLHALRTYSDQLLAALGNAIVTTTFSQSSMSAAQTSVGSYRDTVNALISTLQSAQQQIVASKLGVQSAVDSLTQVTAGSTPEQVAAARATLAAAQANAESIEAQIRNSTIVALFAGTVASVHIKTGDIVMANTPAITLDPESALQATVYFSEIDITKVHVGDVARVTLDAYGSGRVFDAHVVSVDSAPTQIGTGTGYKATLQFLKNDSAIKSGMTANIIISLTK